MGTYAAVAVSSVKEALIFNTVGVAIAIGALLVFQVPLGDSFGLIILLESTFLMLVGGALGVAGQATTRRLAEMITKKRTKDEDVVKSDLQAALYAITGALLFVEALGMAVLLA